MTEASVIPTSPTSSSRWARGLRGFCLGLLVAVGCLAFGAYVVVHWAERQILTTDNWVALVSPLPKQPVVSKALGSSISDQVFQSKTVEQEIKDALPPRAGFLVQPLTSQLKGLTTQAAQKMVASDGFQSVWTGANRLAMNRLLTTARGQTPPLQAKINQRFNVDISGASGQLNKALGSAASAIPALQPASKKALAITTDLHARRQRVHQAVRTMDTLAKVLPWVVIASFLGALALSGHRRHTSIAIAVSVIVLMLIELIALKWLRQEVLDQVHNPGNLQAVGYIYDTLIGWLRNMIYIVLAATAVITLGLFAAGPARWAVSLRSYIHLERLRNKRFMAAWHVARTWVKSREYYLWLGAAVIVLASLALFTQISSQVVINAVLLAVSLFALVHIVGTPPRTVGRYKGRIVSEVISKE